MIRFIKRNYFLIDSCLAKYRRYVYDELTNFPQIEASEIFFNIQSQPGGAIRVTFANQSIELPDYKYLDGFWLEELVYWSIKNKNWDVICKS